MLGDTIVRHETPAGPVEIEGHAGVHAIAPSTLELARRLDVRSGEHVVEIGCGSGLLAIVAAKLGAGRVVAVDLDERACRVAEANARRNGVRVDVRRGSFLEPIAGERFDVALFNPPQTPGPRPFGPKWGGPDGAEHFRAVLPRLGAHLRPGGRALVLVLGLVDRAALEPLLAEFVVESRGETDRPFEASEYDGYAEGLVAYLEDRARAGRCDLERRGPGAFAFKNRYLRLRSRSQVRRLVVNADDLGLHPAKNAAVFRAFERGIVRSASLVAAGPASEEAIAGLPRAAGRAGALDVGLHGNLSEGRALAGPIAGLTDAQGAFFGSKKEVWARLEEPLDASAIERELRAQLAWIEERGVRVTHLDGHQHVQAFPAARDAFIAVARERGLYLRVPHEAPLALLAAKALAPEIPRIRDAARGLEERVKEVDGLRRLDAFRGIAARAANDGVCGLGCLRRSLSEIAEGATVELMVHPQETGSGAAAAREQELRALVDPTWPDWLAERGFALVSFAELP